MAEQKEPQEQWRYVKDNHKYEVSNHGRIRNVKTGRELAQNTRKGYTQVKN